MPTYEYLCHGCGHRLETVQRMSDDPLKECPACHEQALVKQISAVGFQLKGTGWYVTDFRDKGKAKSGGPETKTDQAPKADPKAEAGGDSSAKPAAEAVKPAPAAATGD